MNICGYDPVGARGLVITSEATARSDFNMQMLLYESVFLYLNSLYLLTNANILIM